MAKWVYLVEELDLDEGVQNLTINNNDEKDGKLAKLGRLGWELVTIVPPRIPGPMHQIPKALAFFKKPV